MGGGGGGGRLALVLIMGSKEINLDNYITAKFKKKKYISIAMIIIR